VGNAQLAHRFRVMELLQRKDVFSPGYRESVHRFFAGRGDLMLRNEWGLFHLFNKFQPLEAGV